LSEALGVLADLKGLGFRKLAYGNTYAIVRQDTAALTGHRLEGEGIPDVKISVKLQKASLHSFIEKLSAQTKVSFILADGLEKLPVTAFLSNVGAREALELILEVKGLVCRRGKESKAFLIEREKKAP
jgi:hypothetical protein